MLSGAMTESRFQSVCRRAAPSSVAPRSFRSFHFHPGLLAFISRSPFFYPAPALEDLHVYVCELTKRRYRGKKPKEIRGPDDVVAFVGPKLRKEQREHFLVLLLNARHEVIGRETVSVGSLNASIVHPREVFRPAIIHSAAAIVLAHNHPSGVIPTRVRKT